MTQARIAAGTALRCDAEGRILEIITDEIGGAQVFVPGRLFSFGVDRDSLGKCLSFMLEIRKNGAAFGWELNVKLAGEIRSLHFAGAMVDGHMLITAAASREDVEILYKDLVRITSREVNALRAVMKTNAEGRRQTDTYNDITRVNNELATVQRELAKKNAALDRLNQLKNQFLGMAAHDLRHPIGVVRMYSEFVLDEAGKTLGAEHREFLEIIRTAGETMNQMLDDFLDIAAIEAGKLEMNFAVVDVAALIHRNIRFNRPLAAREQIRLDLTCPESGLTGRVDANRLDQVLNNLINNAIKYSSANTRIDVAVEPAGAGVKIAVKDEGIGIAKEHLAKLFQPFERLERPRTTAEKSSGLGLAIVANIVAGHGGDITVESEPERGSCFRVYLPLDGPAQDVTAR